MKHIYPGVTVVTTMAYDMVTEHDNNVSTEIKNVLISTFGWRDNIPGITIRKLGVRDTIDYASDMPASTLWKLNVEPEDAIQEFVNSCKIYNTNHATDNPPKIARGKAFAICNVQYDAIEIR